MPFLNITLPIYQKCPCCNNYLYLNTDKSLFSGIFGRNSVFICKTCYSVLRWKRNVSLKIMSLSLLLLVASVLMFLSFELLARDEMVGAVFAAASAVFSIMLVVSMLFLEIEGKCKNIAGRDVYRP